MAIKDIFLPLVGEPSAAAIAAIEKCTAVAGHIGARVTAMVVEQDILVRPKVAISSDLENTAATGAVRSVSNAHDLLTAFDTAAARFGVRNEQWLQRFAAADAVDGSSTGTRVPWMWALLRLPRFGGATHANGHHNRF